MENTILTRKQRRSIAKKLGYLGKKETFREMSEKSKRSREFGKMLHLQYLQNMENKKSMFRSEKLSDLNID
jgi:hypothetical protein